jgi:hypothetical protein
VLVTPVIAFLDDVAVLDGLRAAPGEVARIFDHPLEALLDPELVREEETPLVPLGSEDWPYEVELHVSSSTPRVYFCSFGLPLCVCLTVKCRTSRTPHGWAVFIACIVSGAPPRLWRGWRQTFWYAPPFFLLPFDYPNLNRFGWWIGLWKKKLK